MRTLYGERQRLLVAAARSIDALSVTASPAGMHLVGWLPEDADDRAVAQAAAELGVSVTALSSYCLAERPRPGLVLGYAAFGGDEIHAGRRRLGEAIAGAGC